MFKLKKIYFISLPIGNLEDITLRALRLLKESDAVVVENFKNARKTLQLLKIDLDHKKFYLLNQKNQFREEKDLLQTLITHQQVSLVSDGGSPVFADPGRYLVKKLIEYQIDFTFVPGANSLIAGLVLSNFSIDEFHYLGFLSQKKEERNRQLKKAAKIKTLLVIMETPYRLTRLLTDLTQYFDSGISIAITFNLTTDKETIFRGKLGEASKKYKQKKKSPFVIFLDNQQKHLSL